MSKLQDALGSFSPVSWICTEVGTWRPVCARGGYSLKRDEKQGATGLQLQENDGGESLI